MDLTQVLYEITTEPIEGAPTTYCIKIKHIQPNDEAWNLCCDTKNDQERWVKVLEKYADVYNPPPEAISNTITSSRPPSSRTSGSSILQATKRMSTSILSPSSVSHPTTAPSTPTTPTTPTTPRSTAHTATMAIKVF